MVHRCPNCDAQCGCEEYKQLGYCAHECDEPFDDEDLLDEPLDLTEEDEE